MTEKNPLNVKQMKKSNILLIILAVIITGWFVIFQFLCARAVVDISNGKSSGTAFRYEYKKMPRSPIKRPGIPLRHFNTLEIIAKNKVSVTILRGETRAIVLDTTLFTTVKWWFDNGRMVLKLEGKDNKKSQQVRIMVPDLQQLSCYYLEDLYIDGLEQQKLEVVSSDVRYFILRDNKFGSLTLNCRHGGRDNNLSLDRSNVLDSLYLSIGGTGNVDIGCTGLRHSQTSLSDSIRVTGEAGLLKKIIQKQ